MTGYAHLIDGDDEAAAGTFASLASAAEVSAEYQGSSAGPLQQAGQGR
jgi:hypothetical protein